MKRIITISMLFLAVAACDNASLREAAEAARKAREAIAISPERGRINGLRIGSSETEVIAAFGPPAKIEAHGINETRGKPAQTFFYDGIEIFLVSDEIYRLKCRALNCATTDGVKVSDSKDKVVAALGPGVLFQRGDGSEALRYYVTNTGSVLIVDFSDGKVVALTLFFNDA